MGFTMFFDFWSWCLPRAIAESICCKHLFRAPAPGTCAITGSPALTTAITGTTALLWLFCCCRPRVLQPLLFPERCGSYLGVLDVRLIPGSPPHGEAHTGGPAPEAHIWGAHLVRRRNDGATGVYEICGRLVRQGVPREKQRCDTRCARHFVIYGV